MNWFKNLRKRVKVEIVVLLFAITTLIYTCGGGGGPANWIDGTFPVFLAYDLSPFTADAGYPDLLDARTDRPANQWHRVDYFFGAPMWKPSFNPEVDLEIEKCLFGDSVTDGSTVWKCENSWAQASVRDALQKVYCSGSGCFSCCATEEDCKSDTICDPVKIMVGGTVTCPPNGYGDYDVKISCGFANGTDVCEGVGEGQDDNCKEFSYFWDKTLPITAQNGNSVYLGDRLTLVLDPDFISEPSLDIFKNAGATTYQYLFKILSGTVENPLGIKQYNVSSGTTVNQPEDINVKFISTKSDATGASYPYVKELAPADGSGIVSGINCLPGSTSPAFPPHGEVAFEFSEPLFMMNPYQQVEYESGNTGSENLSWSHMVNQYGNTVSMFRDTKFRQFADEGLPLNIKISFWMLTGDTTNWWNQLNTHPCDHETVTDPDLPYYSYSCRPALDSFLILLPLTKDWTGTFLRMGVKSSHQEFPLDNSKIYSNIYTAPGNTADPKSFKSAFRTSPIRIRKDLGPLLFGNTVEWAVTLGVCDTVSVEYLPEFNPQLTGSCNETINSIFLRLLTGSFGNTYFTNYACQMGSVDFSNEYGQTVHHGTCPMADYWVSDDQKYYVRVSAFKYWSAGSYLQGMDQIPVYFDLDPDSDMDGLTDRVEMQVNAYYNNWVLDPCDDEIGTFLGDWDNDGLSNGYEVCYDGDCEDFDPANDLDPGYEDSDNDGITDIDEIFYRTDPLNPEEINLNPPVIHIHADYGIGRGDTNFTITRSNFDIIPHYWRGLFGPIEYNEKGVDEFLYMGYGLSVFNMSGNTITSLLQNITPYNAHARWNGGVAEKDRWFNPTITDIDMIGDIVYMSTLGGLYVLQEDSGNYDIVGHLTAANTGVTGKVLGLAGKNGVIFEPDECSTINALCEDGSCEKVSDFNWDKAKYRIIQINSESYYIDGIISLRTTDNTIILVLKGDPINGDEIIPPLTAALRTSDSDTLPQMNDAIIYAGLGNNQANALLADGNKLLIGTGIIGSKSKSGGLTEYNTSSLSMSIVNYTSPYLLNGYTTPSGSLIYGKPDSIVSIVDGATSYWAGSSASANSYAVFYSINKDKTISKFYMDGGVLANVAILGNYKYHATSDFHSPGPGGDNMSARVDNGDLIITNHGYGAFGTIAMGKHYSDSTGLWLDDGNTSITSPYIFSLKAVDLGNENITSYLWMGTNFGINVAKLSYIENTIQVDTMYHVYGNKFGGVSKVDDKNVGGIQVPAHACLPDNYVYDIFPSTVDGGQNWVVWIATHSGLARYYGPLSEFGLTGDAAFCGNRWRTYTTDQGLASNKISSIYKNGNKLFVGTGAPKNFGAPFLKKSWDIIDESNNSQPNRVLKYYRTHEIGIFGDDVGEFMGWLNNHAPNIYTLEFYNGNTCDISYFSCRQSVAANVGQLYWVKADQWFDRIMFDNDIYPMLNFEFFPWYLYYKDIKPQIQPGGTPGCGNFKNADMKRWQNLVYATLVHLSERYGAEALSQWYFELWNEQWWTCNSNPEANAWLYIFTNDVIRLFEQDKEIKLKFGAPSPIGWTFGDWYNNYFGELKKYNATIDVITNHDYGVNWYDSVNGGINNEIDFLRSINYYNDDKEIWITEAGDAAMDWSDQYASFHSNTGGAMYYMQSLFEGIEHDDNDIGLRPPDIINYHTNAPFPTTIDFSNSMWTFSTFAQQIIKTPVYLLLEALSHSGDLLVKSEKVAGTEFQMMSTLDSHNFDSLTVLIGWPFPQADQKLQNLEFNKEELVNLSITGLRTSTKYMVREYKIDDKHGSGADFYENPYIAAGEKGCFVHPENCLGSAGQAIVDAQNLIPLISGLAFGNSLMTGSTTRSVQMIRNSIYMVEFLAQPTLDDPDYAVAVSNSSSNSDITVDPDGTIHMTWARAGTHSQIVYRQWSPETTQWGDIIDITDGNADCVNPRVASDPKNHRVFIAYSQKETNQHWEIYLQGLLYDGDTIDPPFQVSDPAATTNESKYPDIVAKLYDSDTTKSEIFVAWQDNALLNGNTIDDVYLESYLASSDTINVKLAAFVVSGEIDDGKSEVPSLALVLQGSTYDIYVGWREDYDYSYFYFKFFDTSANLWSSINDLSPDLAGWIGNSPKIETSRWNDKTIVHGIIPSPVIPNYAYGISYVYAIVGSSVDVHGVTAFSLANASQPDISIGPDGSAYITYVADNDSVFYQKVKHVNIEDGDTIRILDPIAVDNLPNFQNFQDVVPVFPKIAVEKNDNINFIFVQQGADYDGDSNPENALVYRYRRN